MDFTRAWQTLKNMWDGTTGALPNIVLAFLIFMIFFAIARRTRTVVIGMTERRQKAKNLGLLLGRLAQSAIVAIGILVSLTIIFPSFRVGDLIQLLGISSVAIGFAFHDLFQNFLAGILLLLTSPFHVGDQIQVENFEGVVEDIKTRATTIKTDDGRRIVIPNSVLFTNSVVVNTAFEKRRQEYVIGISYDDDIEQAKAVILGAVNSIPDVLQDPPAEALVVALAEFSVNICVYWWVIAPRHDDLLYRQDKVLTAIKNRLMEAGITLPYPTRQVLLHKAAGESNEPHLETLEMIETKP